MRQPKSLGMWLVMLGASGAVFVFDRLAKWAVIHGELGQGPSVLPWIEVTTHRNYGLLANFPLPIHLIVILSILALGILCYGLYDAGRQTRIFDVSALSLVLGGALANLYDRVSYGYVFDWLMFFHASIINFADASIAVGLLLYAGIQYFRGRRKTSVDCHAELTENIRFK